jgi:hypothetical protein
MAGSGAGRQRALARVELAMNKTEAICCCVQKKDRRKGRKGERASKGYGPGEIESRRCHQKKPAA